jgi:hypothetical protein
MSQKTIAIIQSNYIPWKGYFDIINLCDEFILLDEVQYTRNDWRNRNKIKTHNGLMWLTIPVISKGKYTQTVAETQVSGHTWVNEHLKTIRVNYAKAKAFKEMFPLIESIYEKVATETYLSKINYAFLTELCALLNITTPITWSTDYASTEGRMERILSLCLSANATEYISGPAAQSYMNEQEFAEQGVKVRYMDYSNYSEYPQVHPPFEHGVSILDLLLNVGEDVPKYMLSFK